MAVVAVRAILVTLTAAWIRAIWRLFRSPNQGDFDKAMNRGFRTVLGGVTLAGIWAGVLTAWLWRR
jgi:hypothetical protein